MSTFKTITGTQSKSADRYAIDVMGIPSLTLMENASACVAERIVQECRPDSRVVLCCGAGNNGADGICIGRLLKNAGFTNVFAVICGRREKATWEFEHQLKEYEAMGLQYKWFGTRTAPSSNASVSAPQGTEDTEIAAFTGQAAFEELLKDADVVVDAVFGIGLHRPVEGLYREFLKAMDSCAESRAAAGSPDMDGAMGNSAARVFAVDLPSGIDSDTGEVMGVAVKADVTVTFGCRKTGLEQGEGPAYSGRIEVVDIDIPEEAYRKAIE